MIATLGDLVDDIIVKLDDDINVASDTAATISHRRGGSAANTAVAAAVLGSPSRFLGQVGDDTTGTALLDDMVAAGVDITYVRRSGSTGTIIALVDHLGERSMLTDRRACIDLTDPDAAWLDDVDVIHIPLYSLAAGAIADTARTVIGWAHDRSIAVSIDVSSVAVMHELGIENVLTMLGTLRPDVIVANRDEAVALGIDGPIAGALTVVKRGPDAAIVHVPGGEASSVPAIAVDGVADTTGAGDAFAAGLLTHDWRADPVGAVGAGHGAAAALLRSRLNS